MTAYAVLVTSGTACALVLGIDDFRDAPPATGASTASGSPSGTGGSSPTGTGNGAGGAGQGGGGWRHSWSDVYNSDGEVSAKGVQIADTDGRLVIAGNFTGSLDFGGEPIQSTEHALEDGYVVALAAGGGHQWTDRFGGPNQDRIEAIALDAAAAVWVVGSFHDQLEIHDSTGEAHSWDRSSNNGDIFIAKLDSVGDHRWSRVYGENAYLQSALGVGLDALGGGRVTGFIEGDVQLGGSNTHSTNGVDLFVLDLDTGGAHRGDVTLGHWGSQWGRDVAVGDDGRTVLAGFFDNELLSGQHATGGDDAFVLKCIDSCYQRSFVGIFGDGEDQQTNAVEVDGTAMVVAGAFRGTIDLGGDNLQSAGSVDAFVAKLDGSGEHLWSYRFGGLGVDRAHDVAVSGDGRVVVTGEMSQTVQFGDCTLTASGADVFVLLLDGEDGSTLWCESFGGDDDQIGRAVDISDDGAVIALHGDLRRSIDFGGGTLSANDGHQGVFVARLIR